jgi:hypothetical protein
MTVPISYPNGSRVLVILTTGQPICLASVLPHGQIVNRVDIQPLTTNTNPIIVGDSTISQTQATGGVLLQCEGTTPVSPDAYTLELLTSLSNVYINGTAGDGVSFNWWIGERN